MCLMAHCYSFEAFGQSTVGGRIEGYVFDATNKLDKKRLEGIRVDAMDSKTGAYSRGEKTDAQGKYLITGLLPGRYYLLANCINPDPLYQQCVPPNQNYNSYNSSKVEAKYCQNKSIIECQTILVVTKIPTPPVELPEDYLRRMPRQQSNPVNNPSPGSFSTA